MAKKHQTETAPVSAATDTIMVAVPAGLVLSYGDWTIPVASATPATLAYCLQNGYHQSMVDAAAFSKDEKEGKTDDEVAEMTRNARQTRHDNIVAGTVGHRVGGPKLRGVPKLLRDVAVERLQTMAAKKGRPWPKGKGAAEKINRLVDVYLSDTGRKSACQEEAERRFAQGGDEAEFDLDAVA